MVLFLLKAVNYFRKKAIIDVWQSAKCASKMFTFSCSSVFRTQSNINDGAFFENSERLLAINCFCKNTLSQILDWNLNTPLPCTYTQINAWHLILDKVFGQKEKNQTKLDKIKTLWFLLFPNPWMLLPKIHFWIGDLGLGCLLIRFWDTTNNYKFPRILILQSFNHSWQNS